MLHLLTYFPNVHDGQGLTKLNLEAWNFIHVSCMGGQGSKYLSHLLLFPRCITRELHEKVSSQDFNVHSNAMPASQVAAYPSES